jgi:hypothetical protein
VVLLLFLSKKYKGDLLSDPWCGSAGGFFVCGMGDFSFKRWPGLGRGRGRLMPMLGFRFSFWTSFLRGCLFSGDRQREMTGSIRMLIGGD